MPKRIRSPLGLLIVVGIVGVTSLLARGYQTLCRGPVDTFPLLAAARGEAQREAGAAPAAPASAFAALRAEALDLVLRVKQSDAVAFPAHALAGAALEEGGCPVAASADQWRKAAGHAWFDGAARLAAAGLARTAGASAGDGATLAALARYAADEPWHAENLARVVAAYRARRGAHAG